MKIKPIDITKQSRPGFTRVDLILDHRDVTWIRLGQSQLRYHEGMSAWRLGAYLGNLTDPEHDSAYLLRLPLIGVEFKGVDYGIAQVNAWIHPTDGYEFRVPDADYTPETERCVTCKGKNSHLMVDGDHYCPPHNKELYDSVRGLQVRIYMGQAPNEE